MLPVGRLDCWNFYIRSAQGVRIILEKCVFIVQVSNRVTLVKMLNQRFVDNRSGERTKVEGHPFKGSGAYTEHLCHELLSTTVFYGLPGHETYIKWNSRATYSTIRAPECLHRFFDDILQLIELRISESTHLEIRLLSPFIQNFRDWAVISVITFVFHSFTII